MSAGANITYDDKDPAFLYQPLKSWTAGLWNASNVGQTGTLHVTNSLDATVNFVRCSFLLTLLRNVDTRPWKSFPGNRLGKSLLEILLIAYTSRGNGLLLLWHAAKSWWSVRNMRRLHISAKYPNLRVYRCF